MALDKPSCVVQQGGGWFRCVVQRCSTASRVLQLDLSLVKYVHGIVSTDNESPAEIDRWGPPPCIVVPTTRKLISVVVNKNTTEQRMEPNITGETRNERQQVMAAFNHINDENSQFSYANIPFGVISTRHDPRSKIATRLFHQVFPLPDLIEKGMLQSIDDETRQALDQFTLNAFAGVGREKHRQVRQALQEILHQLANDGNGELSACAISIEEVVYHLPVHVGDFSDFSCSKDHVLNAGEAVMGVRQLPPGFLHFPVGYGGRSSSILAPGSSVRRPLGQFRTADGIKFGPSGAVDFELELACVIGRPSNFGEPIDISNADDHIFGFLLLNDWSARDIQGLEMNPLGPFNGKSFGTSISPWIITVDALEPFRVEGLQKDLPLATYLQNSNPKPQYSIQLKVEIETDSGRSTICQSRSEWLYWTTADMIAHQTINGCPLNAGDILATGTISGSTADSHGCLLEITKGGKEPIMLSNGATRRYLQDGDTVRMTGLACVAGTTEIVGFGQCYGRLEPTVYSKGA